MPIKVSAGMAALYLRPQIYNKYIKLLLVLEVWLMPSVKCMPHYLGHIMFWFTDEYAHIYCDIIEGPATR
jgi:hypothetical protein